MGDLGATLIKELNCETAFTIGGIGISESVVDHDGSGARGFTDCDARSES